MNVKAAGIAGITLLVIVGFIYVTTDPHPAPAAVIAVALALLAVAFAALYAAAKELC